MKEIKKKTFSERWITRFVRNYPNILKLFGQTFACKHELEEAVLETYDYIFAIAKAAKVQPKTIAKLLTDKQALHDYSGKVIDAQMDLHIKEIEKQEIELAKAQKKAQKKTK